MLQNASIQINHQVNVRQVPARSGRARLAKLDGRTREARFVRELRADLVRHCGGSPSITEAELIDMACDYAMEIEAMKRRRAERGGTLSLHDHKAYISYANGYTRTLAQLGMKGVEAKAPSLAELMAAAAAARAASSASTPLGAQGGTAAPGTAEAASGAAA